MNIQAISANLTTSGIKHVVVSASNPALSSIVKMLDAGIKASIASHFQDVQVNYISTERERLTTATAYDTLFIFSTADNAKVGIRFKLWFQENVGVWSTVVRVSKDFIHEKQDSEAFAAPWFYQDLLGTRAKKRGASFSTLSALFGSKVKAKHVENAFDVSAKKAREILERQ